MERKEKQYRVLTVGPSLKGLGGISSVLSTYKRTIPGFRHLPTNSARGTVPGAFVLLSTLLRMPFFRLSGYNIVHAHGASGKSFRRKMFLLRWARLWGFKTIFHSHNGSFDKYAERVGKDAVAAQLRKCDAVVGLGTLWKDYFTRELGCKNVFVVRNIIEPVVGEVHRDIAPHDPMRLLFLGKICTDKGVYDILDALAAHREEFKGRIEMRFAGIGEIEHLKDMISSMGLGDMAYYVGPVTGETKDKILRECDIIILPSYIEGLPITLLEAGAYHIPSISSNVGCVPELISDGANGTLIEAGKPEQIATAISGYLSMPEKVAEQGKKAAEIIDAYMPRSINDSLEQIYSSVTGK